MFQHNVIAFSKNLTASTGVPTFLYIWLAGLTAVACLPFVTSAEKFPGLYVAMSAAAICVIAFDLWRFQYFASFGMAHPWLEFAKSLLLMVVVSALHILGILLGLSAITYDLVTRQVIENPFTISPSRVEVATYFVDQAGRGALFGLMDMFGSGVPKRVSVEARDHWIFAAMLVALRFVVYTALINGARNMYISSKRWREVEFKGETFMVNLNAVEQKLLTDENIKRVLETMELKAIAPGAEDTSAAYVPS